MHVRGWTPLLEPPTRLGLYPTLSDNAAMSVPPRRYVPPVATRASSARRALTLAVLLGCLIGQPLGAQTPSTEDEVLRLVVALRSGDSATRERAAVALGRLGPAATAAVEPLVATFADENLYLRGAAAVALGRVGAAAVPALIRAIGDPKADVRASAAIALGRLGTLAGDAAPSLARVLGDPDPYVRYCSAVALGEIGVGAKEALPALVDALHDSDEDVRQGARLAIRQVAPQGGSRPRELDALVATVERLVPALMGELRVPGVSVALVRDREVVWSKGFGVKDVVTRSPVSRDTVFEAASMSKPIFAVLAMQLVDGKRLDLDRPLTGYLTEQAVPDQPEKQIVTARMVLSHTSGFPNWRPGGEEREGPLPLLFAPGSRFGYSGEGMFYLQRVVEAIAGQPLDVLAQRALFAPLALRLTGYSWTPDIEAQLATGHGDDGTVITRSHYTHPNAAYTLYTTAGEYARLLVEVMRAEQGSSTLLSADSAREMLRHQVALDGRDPVERPWDAGGLGVFWGLGWSLNATRAGDIAHHGGSNRTGFRCFSQFSPSRGSGLVIMTNGTRGSELWTRLVAAIGDL